MVVRERDYHLFEEAFGFEIICQAKSLGKSTPRSIEIIMNSEFLLMGSDMGEGGLFACDIKHSKNIIQKIQDQAILQISSPNPLASLAPLFILKKDGSISLSRIKKLNISRPGSLTNSDHKIIQNQHEFSAGNHFIRQDSSERENYPCKIVLDAMYTSFLNSHSGGSVKKISTQIDRSGSGSRLALLYDHQLSVSSVFEFSKSAEFSIYDHRTINRFEKCSQDVSFAPLENGNLIAMTTDDSLDILDIRCSSAPVFIKKMIDPCRSLRWSPFVAYWIATGDEKGISIHDLRFTPRPGKFASNKEINDVNSRINLKSASTFCWSNSNAELLLVGDATRQISVWSLLCQSGINATHLTSQKLPEIGGDLIDRTTVRLDLNKEFLRSVAPITCEGVLESEIEKAIYSREIDQAQDLLLTYSSNSTLSIPICSLQRLTNLCCKEEAPNPEEWSISSINVGQIEIFKSTAVKMATTCPFDVNLPVSKARVKSTIDLVCLSVRLGGFLREGRVGCIIDMLPVILDSLYKHPDLINWNLLMGIVNILLAHDRLLALKTGHRILAIIALDASKILDSYMAEMIYNLLKPTIFDLKLIDSEKLTKMMESSSNLDMRIIDHRIEKSKDDHSSTFIKNQYGDIMSSSVLRNNAVIKQHSKTCNFRPNMWELMIDVIRTSIGTVQRGLAMIDLEIHLLTSSGLKSKCTILIPDGKDGSLDILKDMVWTINAQTAASQLRHMISKSEIHAYLHHLGHLMNLVTNSNISKSIVDCDGQIIKRDYPFVSESMAFFEGEVMKSVKKTINNAIETRRPTLVLRGVYILAAIVDGIRPLPRQIEPYILDRLRKLARILPTEDYIGTAGYEALSEYMRSIPLPDLSGKFYRERENGKRDSLCICENLGVWREIEALKNLLSK